jgi:hypothetical protein
MGGTRAVTADTNRANLPRARSPRLQTPRMRAEWGKPYRAFQILAAMETDRTLISPASFTGIELRPWRFSALDCWPMKPPCRNVTTRTDSAHVRT